MPSFTDIASTVITSAATVAADCAASAVINYGVSTAIAPFMGPVGAAFSPRLFAAAGQTIATSATAAVITSGIMTCVKAAVVNQSPEKAKTAEKIFNEEFDDTDVPLTAKP